MTLPSRCFVFRPLPTSQKALLKYVARRLVPSFPQSQLPSVSGASRPTSCAELTGQSITDSQTRHRLRPALGHNRTLGHICCTDELTEGSRLQVSQSPTCPLAEKATKPKRECLSSVSHLLRTSSNFSTSSSVSQGKEPSWEVRGTETPRGERC